ncbi:CPBP family intramembrane metalloprotease [Paracrocinitomix mangrovi]|uniref:CPBP family intramembrane glutamic endopeptidase n=1 Tax=Paracrocinitomix mangrovi TaxID=2862509 RepID=UPI001C8E02A7|nr:CPBP family intramembrane glutamic endopeptidase [Paracrocinitomix mangrovi]UKN01280.1 CPBP family intramembrane metalloprotease [Paracrocinitomix mangrovi]
MRSKFNSLWILGLATLIVFPLLAWPIMYFQGISFESVFVVELPQLYSIPSFLSAGIIFGLIVIWLTELPFFDDSLSKYRDLLSNLKINRFHVIFLSICAGVGEEIFFRGAIQPLLGIIITAIFFVAIHGYFSYKEPKVNAFAILLTAFIMFLGWAARELTIYHAIAGHFSYDLVLLAYYRKNS